MKNLYVIILTLLSPAFLFSQNFAPINQDTKSLYSVNETGKTFSLSIENMFTANGNSFYATLLIPQTNYDVSDTWCSFSPGRSITNCALLGDTIIRKADETWVFFNLNNDSIYFNPNLNQGSEQLLAQFENIKYSLSCTSVGQENFLQTTDQVKTFTLQAKDMNNNNISSPWNGKEVKVSQNSGIIEGVNFKYFPDSIQTYQIIGSVPLQQGIYRISSADIYDFQPGDIFQHRNRDYLERHPNSFQNHDSIWFEKITILERTDFTDSVVYLIQKKWFMDNSLIENIDTVTSSFPKTDTIAIVPIEKPVLIENVDYWDKSFQQIQLDTGKYWNYSLNYFDGAIYCPATNCITYLSSTFLQSYKTIDKTLGLGLFQSMDYARYEIPSEQYFREISSRLVYFKKGNVTWGFQYIVGEEEIAEDSKPLTISPNPAHDNVRIESPISGTLQIIDLNGQIVYSNMIKENSPEELSIAQYSKGIYLVRIINNKTAITKKFIKN
ncbi:MAG: T9SS type A sorting domain-containing protein [Sphingobacteriia bacterium]|nr:T9SS type A sorting domain-containing protein [Sphingobacteriia bacterium]